MGTALEDFRNLVAYTEADHARLVERDEAGTLAKLLGVKAYTEFKSGTGRFRIGITLGEREALFKEERREAQELAAAARQLNKEEVRCVMARHQVKSADELDFILSVVPNLQAMLETARIFKEQNA